MGDVLCDMYAKYWKPSEMARYLEEAASYARNRKSTLSMTDSVSVCIFVLCVPKKFHFTCLCDGAD